ncbi:MAG: hypothetical protein C4K48_02425 [Candidatus Thorarchaeota archaeon]|nr:MAG: hypothetical protein C4K48_02425 [Candidatus Thorarchaeota archaeon]
MRQVHVGLLLMIGSAIVWSIVIAVLFDYIVNVLHSDLAFGEPIWVIDPLGFMVISVSSGIVFFLGLLAVFDDIIPRE